MNHLMSDPIIFWNAVMPDVTSHEYFRVVILSQFFPGAFIPFLISFPSLLSGSCAIHVQLAPGICSVVITVIFEFVEDAAEFEVVVDEAGWEFPRLGFITSLQLFIIIVSHQSAANTPDIQILKIRRELNVIKRRMRLIKKKISDVILSVYHKKQETQNIQAK